MTVCFRHGNMVDISRCQEVNTFIGCGDGFAVLKGFIDKMNGIALLHQAVNAFTASGHIYGIVQNRPGSAVAFLYLQLAPVGAGKHALLLADDYGMNRH